jgi:hypothetical protein
VDSNWKAPKCRHFSCGHWKTYWNTYWNIFQHISTCFNIFQHLDNFVMMKIHPDHPSRSMFQSQTITFHQVFNQKHVIWIFSL